MSNWVGYGLRVAKMAILSTGIKLKSQAELNPAPCPSALNNDERYLRHVLKG